LCDKTARRYFNKGRRVFRQQKKLRAASFAGKPDFSTVRRVLELDLQTLKS
jgi:hypothetical protein